MQRRMRERDVEDMETFKKKQKENKLQLKVGKIKYMLRLLLKLAHWIMSVRLLQISSNKARYIWEDMSKSFFRALRTAA